MEQEKIKIVIVGDASVGKTCILKRHIEGKFEDGIGCTIGADFNIIIKEMQGKKMKFEIWDTAGQDKFQNLIKLYYKDADIAILVYDVLNQSTFKTLQDTWVQKLKDEGKENLFLIMAGNKQDIIDEKGPQPFSIPFEFVQQYAEKENIQVVLTSAKTGKGVDELFERIQVYAFNQKFPGRSSLPLKQKPKNNNQTNGKCKC